MTAIALETTSINVPDALRRDWRAWLVLAAMAALFAVTVAGIVSESIAPRPALEPGGPTTIASLRAAVPATSATQLRRIAPENAIAINASIPIAGLANPAARPIGCARSIA